MQTNLIDATVRTADGQAAGTVWRVAIDPVNHKVTHLVVHQGFLMGRNVVVPIEHVVERDEEELRLDLDAGGMQRLPDYLETDFLPPEEGWDYPVGYPPGGVVWPMSMTYIGATTYPELSNAIVKENLPEGELEIASGADVECTDGHCGKIERLLVDAQSNELTGFVIRRGFFFTRDVKAPVAWIDHVDQQRVHLKLTRQQLREMAEYFD